MNTQEITGVLKVIRVSYPNFYRGMTKEQAKEIVEVWSMMFVDDDAKVVINAVKSLVQTLKYPPTIAEIKQRCRLITQPKVMTEMEAWTIVKKAISNYDAGENFEKLPVTLQILVGSAAQLREWALMDNETLNSVVQSNFMRSYKAKVNSDVEYQSLSDDTKMLVDGLGDKYKIQKEK